MIETVNLTKRYGDFHAIRDINIKLDAGDLFGFIGPNGAGKTTTMRILATLLEPTSGEAYVCGNSIYNDPREIRRLVGYMPDFFGVYEDMTVMEYLEFFATAYRIYGDRRRKLCLAMLDQVDLAFKQDAQANTLSRGQTQRLGLARTLLHDPQVMLLDEPLSGLDPEQRIRMRDLLLRLGQRGKTILVSSHILPELGAICNKIGIINKGEMEISASVDEVMRMVREYIVLDIQVDGELDAQQRASELLLTDAEVATATAFADRLEVTLRKETEDYSHLPTLLIENGFKIKRFLEEHVDLEKAFIRFTELRETTATD